MTYIVSSPTHNIWIIWEMPKIFSKSCFCSVRRKENERPYWIITARPHRSESVLELPASSASLLALFATSLRSFDFIIIFRQLFADCLSLLLVFENMSNWYDACQLLLPRLLMMAAATHYYRRNAARLILFREASLQHWHIRFVILAEFGFHGNTDIYWRPRDDAHHWCWCFAYSPLPPPLRLAAIIISACGRRPKRALLSQPSHLYRRRRLICGAGASQRFRRHARHAFIAASPPSLARRHIWYALMAFTQLL